MENLADPPAGGAAVVYYATGLLIGYLLIFALRAIFINIYKYHSRSE
ncbi:MAG: hypothetical protein U9R14_04945 [Patescibacteria group bacterium]|nr:hypothetical protein [Patescibacteria group bacterium]